MLSKYLTQRFQSLNSRIRNYNEKTSWLVIVFLTVFAISSWIDMHGVWTELPIMVHELPEGWRLPSVLGLMTQISQIGPLIFLIFKCLAPKRNTYVFTIYLILTIAAASCFLLCFFWDKTTQIGSEQRSIGLYILTFTLGLLDGTSTVTYLTYIGTTFKKEYIIANYLGESLSAMIPGVVGMIQGAGKDLGCRNVSVNESQQQYELQPIPLVPLFSVSIYFFFLFVCICVSTIAFSLAQYLPISRKAKKDKDTSAVAAAVMDPLTETNDNKEIDSSKIKPKKVDQIILLFITTGCTFLIYGVLPALQSYSTLPYSNDIFHLSITLCFFFLPFSTFLSIWSNNLSTLRISIEFLTTVSFATYLIVISTMSPCPPFLNSTIGPAMTLISWLICYTMFMRIRYCISAKLEACGETTLLLIGTCTLTGQVIGGVLMYILIDVYRLFKDVPSCIKIADYCAN